MVVQTKYENAQIQVQICLTAALTTKMSLLRLRTKSPAQQQTLPTSQYLKQTTPRSPKVSRPIYPDPHQTLAFHTSNSAAELRMLPSRRGLKLPALQTPQQPAVHQEQKGVQNRQEEANSQQQEAIRQSQNVLPNRQQRAHSRQQQILAKR